MVTVLSGHAVFHRPPMSFLSAASGHTLVLPTTSSMEDFRSALGQAQAVSIFSVKDVSHPFDTGFSGAR